MTTKYECDRCKRQTTDSHEFASIRTTTWVGGRAVEHELHYCGFCSMMMNNAVSIVNSGAYGGSLDKNDKIGKYVPHRDRYDPLVKEASE